MCIRTLGVKPPFLCSEDLNKWETGFNGEGKCPLHLLVKTLANIAHCTHIKMQFVTQPVSKLASSIWSWLACFKVGLTGPWSIKSIGPLQNLLHVLRQKQPGKGWQLQNHLCGWMASNQLVDTDTVVSGQFICPFRNYLRGWHKPKHRYTI